MCRVANWPGSQALRKRIDTQQNEAIVEYLVSMMNRPINRIAYAAWGFGLMLFKYLVEY